ncbi:MAG: serine/threonine protein kinase [Planctomycetes bacterium]|nr:serine/threonine protein kinase [Planctomycetota bacterium]
MSRSLEIEIPSLCTPGASELGRKLYQKRVAVFIPMLLALCFGFYFLANRLGFSTSPGLNSAHWIDGVSNRLHLASCLILAALWPFGSWRKKSYAWLRLIDPLSTIIACAGYALGSFTLKGMNAEYQALLATSVTLIVRGLVIPNGARRALWIGAAASMPTTATAFFLYHSPEFHLMSSGNPGLAMSVFSIWCAVALTVSSVVSKVVWSLRCEANQARRIGQYTLEEKIGSGSMGEVYKASHALLRRPTAIKICRCDLGGERCAAGFEREVQLTSRLRHPNTITIYDYGRTREGDFYYAMEYLPGLSLEQLVRQHGPQPPGRVIHILKQVCASLAEAHGIGLIHRDIKAANIILCALGGMHDVVKVLDFGLVKDLDQLTEDSPSGDKTISGTPHYMPPEAIRSPEKLDPRADLYSVGVLGYFLLTGKHVFDGLTFFDIWSQHLNMEPIPPSARTSSPIPKDLEDIVLMCLEKDPSRRPPDAPALGQGLQACESSRDWNEVNAETWWKEFTSWPPDDISTSTDPTSSGSGSTVVKPVTSWTHG